MTVSTIILAAGKGTRMKSPKPKILHKIAGKYLIDFCVELANRIKSKETIVVVGEEHKKVTKNALSDNGIKFCLQKNQLGTGDAVKIAIKNMRIRSKYILVLYGDTPFIKTGTIKKMIIKVAPIWLDFNLRPNRCVSLLSDITETRTSHRNFS